MPDLEQLIKNSGLAPSELVLSIWSLVEMHDDFHRENPITDPELIGGYTDSRNRDHKAYAFL